MLCKLWLLSGSFAAPGAGETGRPGGIVAIDNVLWYGRVAGAAGGRAGGEDRQTQALRELNKKLYADARIAFSLVPIGDGLSLCRKL